MPRKPRKPKRTPSYGPVAVTHHYCDVLQAIAEIGGLGIVDADGLSPKYAARMFVDAAIESLANECDGFANEWAEGGAK